MLLSFTAGNYCCFKEKQSLSLKADGRHAAGDDRVAPVSQALRVAGIYGDTASGKSHLLRALQFMRSAVLEGWNAQLLHCSPFLSDNMPPAQPSFFEIIFQCGETRYRYGFEVQGSHVQAEWLYERKARRELRLFSRSAQALQVHSSFTDGRRLIGVTPSDMLLLSIAARLRFVHVLPIINFLRSLQIIDAATEDPYSPGWEEQLAIPTPVLTMQQLYHELGMEHVATTMRTQIKAQASGYRRGAVMLHTDIVGIAQASRHAALTAGTRSLLAITPAILKAINEGGVLFVDDLDAHLSLAVLQGIVRIFQDPETNPLDAQFVFTTHLHEWLRSGKWLSGQRYILQKPVAAASLEHWTMESKRR